MQLNQKLDDARIDNIKPLISPEYLCHKYPIPNSSQQLIETSRKAISDILHGFDDRLLVIVGPCSIHDHDQAIAYAKLLKEQADVYANELLIVMRVYFEKPRTTVGWKGYINDPHLDGSFAINDGLEMARKLLLEIVEIGLPVGTEFLDLLSPQFFSDLISWGAIGARTTESQSHRQLASGLSCPVGFKNGTDGNIKVASDAILSAQSKHAFIGMTKSGQSAIFETNGNDDCHVILRGGKQPNYEVKDIDAACDYLTKSNLRPQVMIDVSHANSSKEHQKQIEVANYVGANIALGDNRIIGLMIESHLNEGRQDITPNQRLKYGISITDACISFEQTKPLFNMLSDALKKRRSLSS